MIVFDLKLALFVIISVVGISVWGIWKWTNDAGMTNRPSNTMTWYVEELLPFGIVVLYADGLPVFVNPVAACLLGLSEHELLAANNQVLRYIIDNVPTQLPQNGVIAQPLPLRWWCYQLDQSHILLVLANLSDQQHTIRKQQTFISKLSHELRTPLTALVTHTEIARNPQISEELHQASLLTIQRETQRMANLVSNLLELHRLEIIDELLTQEVNVVLIAEAAIAQMLLQAEAHKIYIDLVADTRLPLVLAHADRLTQVFLSLLDNAIKYCRTMDTVTVRLTAQPAGVECLIQDTGLGISAADLPHIVEPLYRARSDIEGSGLGLALVNEIVQQHNATLLLESSTETGASGTKVSWILPYAPVANL